MALYNSGDAITVETGDVLAGVRLFSHDFEIQTAKTFDSQRMEMPFDCTLEEIHAAFKTAPTGQDAVFNIKRNGVELFSGAARPTLAAGETVLTKTEIGEAISAGDYIEWMDVQAGSGTKGGYGVITLVFK